MKKNTVEPKRIFNRALFAVSAAMLIFLAAVVYFGLVIAKKYRDSLVGSHNASMLQTVQSTADSLEQLISEYSADLRSYCRAVSSGTADSSALLASYVEEHSPAVVSISIEEKTGEFSAGNPIAKNASAVLSSTRIDEKTTLMLSRFPDSFMALVLSHRYDSDTRASMVISVKQLYELRIEKFRFGEDGYFVIKDSKGIILMHPEEKQWGIQVISGREKMYPGKDLSSLEKMISHQLEGKTGIESYSSYWWAKDGEPRSRKISAYAPTRLGDDFLVVSAVTKADDIDGTITESLSRIFLLFALFTVGVILMVSYIMYLSVKNKRSLETASYFAKMNDVLEQLHQSEEHIAHQQRLQIIGTMTSGIAHEFNNLLTPIMGYAELLLLSLPDGSDEKDSASEIYSASEKARDIIQQLSGMSRRNIESAFKALGAADFLQKAMKMVRTVCPENVQLSAEINLGDEKILGNATQLNQAILNISVNAIFAIAHKAGHLLFTASAVDKAELLEVTDIKSEDSWKQYLKIDIADDGCGMSEAVMNRMFEPFFTTKKSGQGTGLGLSVTEQIVSSHRGYIYAHSVLGSGTVFHLYFPIISTESAGVAESAEEAKAQISLLVVDDNRKVLNQLERSFKKMSVAFSASESFEDARKKIERNAFDVIVLEEFISGESAIDFCMQSPVGNPIKIIMADMVNRELAEAKQYHIIDDYILKPVSVFSIIRAMKDCRRE